MPRNSRKFRFPDGAVLALGLAILLPVFYRPVLDQFFHHDDFVFLERSRVRSIAEAPRLLTVERNLRGLVEKTHSYRPLSTNVYFGVLRGIFGLRPTAFHLANLVLLLVAALFLRRFLVLDGVESAAAAVAATIFAVGLPARDAQLWIACCQELMAVALLLGALVLHAKARGRGGRWSVAAAAMFMAAVLAKETAIVLPALVLFHEMIVRREGPRRSLAAAAPYTMIAAVYLVWRLAVIPLAAEGPYVLAFGGFWLEHLARYGAESAAALGLGGSWPGWTVGGMAAVALFVRAESSARRICVWGILWWMIALLPVMPLRNHAETYYLLMPGAGLLIAAAALVGGVLRRILSGLLRRGIVLAVLIAFIAPASLAFRAEAEPRGRHTRTAESIVRQLLDKAPSPEPHTRFLLRLPRRFAAGRFLKDRGAVLRVFYDDPTVSAAALAPRSPDILEHERSGAVRIFELLRSGELVERIDRRPAPRAEPAGS